MRSSLELLKFPNHDIVTSVCELITLSVNKKSIIPLEMFFSRGAMIGSGSGNTMGISDNQVHGSVIHEEVWGCNSHPAV